MTTLVAQIAPQRSTQYADLARQLAPHELQLSKLGAQLSNLEPVELAGQDYLRFDLPDEPDAEQLAELGALAMTSAFFVLRNRIADEDGPWLRPLATGLTPAFPPELVSSRRYRGKTNEMFTQFLCNLARSSSGLADQPWSALRLFDPLAGGGTTLFTALMLGAEAAGVEQNQQDVATSATFLTQFMREQAIACQVKEERLKKLGRRWAFTIGKRPPRRCILAQGDTLQSPALIAGFRPHLIVTDLPYGIQHQGKLAPLLSQALPVWAGLLPKNGALVFSWDATRFERAAMVALVEATGVFVVESGPGYAQLAHRVDRVIKARDLIVARPR